MKKHLYLLLSLLTLTPTLATQKIITSTIIASTLVLSHSSYDKKLSLDLHKAVEQNNTTNALQLITNPQVDINAKVDYGIDAWMKGFTPLLWCCRQGNQWLPIAQALLKRKDINVNLPDNNGNTPLIWCAWKGDDALEIAHALLGHKNINVNLQNNNGCTPLDSIIYWIKQNKENYKYVQLWNLLAAQGAVLKKRKAGYHNLKPSDFKEPHKGYVQAIKNNPPKNCINNVLYKAIEQGNTTLAQNLINKPYVDINAKTNDYTPLIMCCKKGDKLLNLAKILINHPNIDVNFKVEGWEPLLWCLYYTNQSLGIAQALLNHPNIDVNVKDKRWSYTPLDYIIHHLLKEKPNHEYVQLWNLLVAQGGILNKRKADYQNLKPSDFKEPQKSYVQAIKNNPPKNCIHHDMLYQAIEQGNTTLAQNLINKPYVDINAKTNGTTPLIQCCEKGDKSLQIAQALLNHPNIDVNVKDKWWSYTPLDYIIHHLIKQKPNHEYVQLWNLLVQQGALLNKQKKDYENLKPSDFKEPHKGDVQAIKNNPPKCINNLLYKAIKQGNTTLAQNLINNPYVDINAKTNGTTPLIQCCKKGDKSLPIAQALLKDKNININLQNNKGWTPLIMCADKGDDALHIAQLLLARKEINVNLQDNLGWTPLIMCSERGDKSLHIAQALLKRKEINVNLQDNDGWTPLIMCCDKGKKSLHIAQALLKRKEINVNLEDNYGETPLIWCCKQGNQSLGIAQALLNHPNVDVNVKDKRWSYTPLDYIIHHLIKQKPNHEYVQLWNLLVAQGALLNKQKKAYQNLNPNHFQEPQKSHVQAIKNNPPTDFKFIIINTRE